MLQIPIPALELTRLNTLRIPEKKLWDLGYTRVAGIDEAGRGPLAGPVVAAACIIPDGIWFIGVNDSKKLTAQKRHSLYEEIISHPKISFGIGIANVNEIDQINIYQATRLAMRLAVQKIAHQPDYLLVDGNMALNEIPIPSQSLIQGDAKSYSIAAASILAKETRDRLMMEIDKEWPQYGFAKHKGYGTQEHLKALSEHGPCLHHRKSFEPVAILYQNLISTS